jgi:hypothetical protein
MPTPHDLQQALQHTRDRRSFLQRLLIDALHWPIPDHVSEPEEISFAWSAADLRADDLTKPLVDGQVWQIQSLQGDQLWGIFLLEFKNADAFVTGRGLTGPLRKVLRGLVPSRRRESHLASWQRENLLFICTHEYQYFRFAYFKAPPEGSHAAPLAAFGWGPDMPARTACEHNLPALDWPEPGTSPADWTSAWASAFDVEKVTRKFYADYYDCFTALEKAIGKENGLKDEDDLRMFTQTLVNRLMFLRFLERKGWLKFGDKKDYLRALYEAGPLGKKSFYRGRLLPLFFEGLATENSAAVVITQAYGAVPFLNGGLFEPTELDKKVKDVSYEALARLIAPGGLFYRYNFTVEESTPLDIEVAVDPEMLGKVFEELVTGRHETGSYYTPRPIVSFMCREALKGYLAGKTKAKPEAIAALVDRADVAGLTMAQGRQILAALDNLKAVDPACGSGAYLLGLLHELVAIYQRLISGEVVKDSRSIYDLKLSIISNNLYGVDIDPFATNIAMLRLWLSLEVEADQPLPLPNLDFKIETGDSLLGPDPGEMRAAQAHDTITTMPNLFGGHLRALADSLLKFKEKYLTAHGEERERYRKAVADLESDIEKDLSAVHGEGVIDWRVHFAEVFVENKGFDIVLANPPYVFGGNKGITRAGKDAYKLLYKSGSRKINLFTLFIERGAQILRPHGALVYIVPNTLLRVTSYANTRQLIVEQLSIRKIVDLDVGVFDAVTASTIMISVAKDAPNSKATGTLICRGCDDAAPATVAQTEWKRRGYVIDIFSSGTDRNLLDKLTIGTSPLGDLCSRIRFGVVISGNFDDVVMNKQPNKKWKPFLEGHEIGPYYIKHRGRFLHYDKDLLHRSRTSDIFESRKIMLQRITGGDTPLKATIDDRAFYNKESILNVILNTNAVSYEYVLAILNSRLANWFYKRRFTNSSKLTVNLSKEYVGQIPIRIPDKGTQKRVELLVSRTLAMKARDAEEDVTGLEREIDQLVFRIYGLTDDEILAVERSCHEGAPVK